MLRQPTRNKKQAQAAKGRRGGFTSDNHVGPAPHVKFFWLPLMGLTYHRPLWRRCSPYLGSLALHQTNPLAMRGIIVFAKVGTHRAPAMRRPKNSRNDVRFRPCGFFRPCLAESQNVRLPFPGGSAGQSGRWRVGMVGQPSWVHHRDERNP